MKIRVALILLLCTSFAANSKVTSKAQKTSANSQFPEIDSVTRSAPRHRVREYSRTMKTLNDDVRNDNGRTTNPDISNSVDRSLPKESGGSLKQMTDMRMNSKQPSEAFEGLPPRGQVLSRKIKDKMDEAMLPLLIAYKMKFAALIPILLGGLSLLTSTTALAGFFFALFAAVLGLKAH